MVEFWMQQRALRQCACWFLQWLVCPHSAVSAIGADESQQVASSVVDLITRLLICGYLRLSQRRCLGEKLMWREHCIFTAGAGPVMGSRRGLLIAANCVGWWLASQPLTA